MSFVFLPEKYVMAPRLRLCEPAVLGQSPSATWSNRSLASWELVKHLRVAQGLIAFKAKTICSRAAENVS